MTKRNKLHGEQAHEAEMISRKIHALLHGRDPSVQSAILADCLSLWLAGHVVEDDAAATAAVRADLLAAHLGLVNQLLVVNAEMIDRMRAREASHG